jgi:DNA polymerase-3 subunit alpha
MFVHLHCHSHYSFLRAVPSPGEIVAAAAREKMTAVALTDTGGLYAAVPFYQAAREAGVKPIVGATIEIEAGGTKQENGKEKTEKGETLLLLAADHAGYSNLCELVTRHQLEEKPVSLELLNAHRGGLIALYAPGARAAAPETETAARLKEAFGDALYLEVRHFPVSAQGNLRRGRELGRALGAPLAATNQVHFLRPK